MAKENSRVKTQQPIPPWKQLHHWQGVGLVLFMLPLGASFILGSAAIEQANRKGLPEPGWTDELAQNLGSQLSDSFSGTTIAQAVQWTSQGIKQWQPPGIARLLNQNLPQGLRVAETLEDSKESPKPISLRRRHRRAITNEIDDLSSQTHQRLGEAMAERADLDSKTSDAPNHSPNISLSIAPDLRRIPPSSTVPNNEIAQQQYSPAEVESFLAIALGTEFSPNGQTSDIPHIRKWTQDLRIQVHGQPTPTDIATLEQVVAEINDLLGSIELGFVASEPNLEIFFVAEQDFSQYESSYQPVNHGFFWSEAHQGAIQRGRILISTTDINQTERSHLIREELTQSLGLMQDSFTDANSIFFQGWSQTKAYSQQDQQLLQMLYRPDIHPGMNAIAAQRVLLGS